MQFTREGKLPRYYFPDNQTMIVSSRPVENGKLNFFTADEGQGYVGFLFIVSSAIIIGIDILLKSSNVGCTLFSPDGCILIVLLFTLQFALMKFWHILYRTDISIKRDGTVAKSIRVLGFILSTKVFEKGHYKFIVEGNSEEVYGGPEGIDRTWEAHRMSIVDEAGRQFSLFIAPRNDGIKEFLKEFSNFTGFLPDVKLDS